MQKLQHYKDEFFQNKVNFSTGTYVDCSLDSQKASFPYYDFTPHLQKWDKQKICSDLSISQVDKVLINEQANVSSNPNGVCMVTRTVLLNHSHSGTHADTPLHFLEQCDEMYDDKQYQGDCILILVPEHATSISIKLVESILQTVEKENVFRILFATWSKKPLDESRWSDEFCFIEPEAAHYMVNTFPNLLCVGTDAPSIDYIHAAPIKDFCHGIFYSKRVAILENLRFDQLFAKFPNLLEQEHFRAYLQCRFVKGFEEKDAKTAFCTMYLYS